MQRACWFSRKALAIAVASALLTACGGGGGGGSSDGGGGGGDVSGLTMPAKLSVVTDTSNPSGKPKGMLNATARAVYGNLGDLAGTQFTTDPQNVWVWDDSMQSLSIVNEILCMARQTAADEMVNQGAYVAQINATKCSSEGQNQSNASQGGGQSSGSSQQEQTEYERWTVLSTRADDSSPQEVKIWIPGKPYDPMNEGGPMDAQNIVAEITINESPSDTKPFGDFVLNFKGIVPGSVMSDLTGGDVTTAVKMMEGTLKSVPNDQGQPQFSFINLGGQAMGGAMAAQMPFSMVEKTNVVLDDGTGTGGVAKTFFEERFDSTGNGSIDDPEDERWGGAHDIAFDASYFLAGKDSDGDGSIDAQRCTDRDGFNTQIWRYNLYHTAAGTFNGRSVTAGQRVKLESGFPFRYTSGSEERHGHVGYWGVWTEDGQGLSDGQAIEKETYNGQAGEQYTVNMSDGKLHKRTRYEATLDKLVGAGLNWYGDPDRDYSVDPVVDGPLPERDYRMVVVDNGASATPRYLLKIKGGLEWTNNGPKLVTVSGINPDDSATWIDGPMPENPGEDTWMWSDSLGGSIILRYAEGVKVLFFKEGAVSPAEIADGTTVTCYERCLKGGLSGAVATEDDLFHIVWNDGMGDSHEYRISTSGGTISFIDLDPDNNAGTSGTAAVTLDGVDLSALLASNPWYEWGVQTGEMVTATVSNWWEVFDAATTYRWETGNQDWNRQVSVTKVSDSSVVNFDKPLHLEYAYSAGDDPNGNTFADGTVFMLEYGGPGQLWGFPWEPEEGCDVETDQCRWYSALNLNDGVQMTDGTDTFVVKGLDMEKTMGEVDVANCTGAHEGNADGLNIDNVNLALPTSVDEQVTTNWSDKPSTTTIKVIEGEVQS